MSHRYYHVCCSNIGRAVEIRMKDGRICRGIISHVTNTQVFLRPLGRSISGNGQQKKGENAVQTGKSSIKEHGNEIIFGFGFGGFGTGLALGAIASLAFLPFFFW